MLLSSAQPSPFSLLTPPAPPAPKAAPGFLAQHDFVGAEAEFMHIMRLAAESPPAPPGAIARVGFLHGLLNAHYAAISVMGGPAYSLPPLPASLSMPGAPPTQTAPAPAGVPANSASPTAQRKAHSWAAAVSPLAAAPGVKILQRTGAPAAPTDASQPRQTRPEPVKPDTVASVLSGPVPKSLGGSRMNANDVLNVNRTFFRNFAECESPPQIAQFRRDGFLTPTSTVRVVLPCQCALFTGDPVIECYYIIALESKLRAKREAAARSASLLAAGVRADDDAAPIEPRSALDAVAILSFAGAQAVKRSGGGGGGGAAVSTASAAMTNSQSVNATLLQAAADIAGAVPIASEESRRAIEKLSSAQRLHAIKRRKWETANSVLGRQESANMRGPKASLNLSVSGVTTADDIRRAGRRGANHTVGVEADDAEDNDDDATPVPGAAQWAARARVEDCLDLVLSLQESARRLMSALRDSATPARTLDKLRRDVANIRASLGTALGIEAVEGAAARAADGAVADGAETPKAAAVQAAAKDNTLISLLSFAKGKKLLARSVPMLSHAGKLAACAAGIRLLPQWVASFSSDAEAEETDAALASALASWLKAAVLPPGAKTSLLKLLASWVAILHTRYTGATVRALLAHPGAMAVISALLNRGEAERVLAEESQTATPDAGVVEALAAWREATETLGAAFLESE